MKNTFSHVMARSSECPALLLAAAVGFTVLSSDAAPWKRFTIDNASKGADGVRLADANGDGLPDIVTGWEEGGTVRICFHPGTPKVRAPWPSVTVGQAPSVEDAVLVDLDAEGAWDVVSSSEGNARRISVHWGPPKRDLLKSEQWKTEVLPASELKMQWMFCLPLDLDGQHGPDLVAGGKNQGAQLGWFESPVNPRRLDEWKWHPWREAGWIMSIVGADMDHDGDRDVVFSDRKGERTGCYWLENPGPNAAASTPWTEHLIGAAGREVMFLTLADFDRDGLDDVLVATKKEIVFLHRSDRLGRKWATHSIPVPSTAGGGKAVAAGDLNLDGRLDIALTCEGANQKSGVIWLSYSSSPFASDWKAHDISGQDGVKHDLIELLDLDGDGDLDVLTCEETRNLGVIWYENPNGKGHRAQGKGQRARGTVQRGKSNE
jgi:hypothetical protein